MALPGETISLGASPECNTCCTTVRLDVYKSGAGWYIGSWCKCGPCSRESLRYWATEAEARTAWKSGNWERR